MRALHSTFLSFFFIFLLLFFILTANGSSFTTRPTTAACNGTIAECAGAEVEALMDSETHRRILQSGNHIGYGAMEPDRPACSAGGGKSYTGHCVSSRSGNPPSRGCNPYDRCRTG